MSDGKEEKEIVLSLDDSELTAQIKLVSMDKKEFEVAKSAVMISNLVKTTIADMDTTATEVPVSQVDSECLQLIVEYMNHHKGTEAPLVEKPLRSKIMKDICKDEWDATFIDGVGEKGLAILKRLVLAANYMDIKGLLFLSCAKVSSLIKGKELSKIKEILNPEKTGVAVAVAVARAETKQDEGKEEKKS